jgi:DMSO/TMAO reductase YedYZ molybdopterin-dependent catalytic subunit
MPRVQGTPPLVCPGFFIDRSTYSGTPLAPIIAQAGPQASAGRVELTSADGYQSVVGLAEAQAEGNFLAYGWEGEALPILHGFPVRAVFPTQEGNKWVKWLVRIELR